MTRISFPFKGGPLDGKELRHYPLPANPEEPFLFKFKTGPKEAGLEKDRVAQGRYRLEEQDGKWAAVHHPSDDDQDWHEVKEVVQPPAEAKPEPGMSISLDKPADPARRRVEIHPNSRAGRKLAALAKDLGFVKQLREKEAKKEDKKPE
jgi:hypothetical protein